MHQAEVVVIGAGMAGLSLARDLMKSGIDVLCIEKSRGTGGRLASKRVMNEAFGVLAFDLGASSFQATNHSFKNFLVEAGDKVHRLSNGEYVAASRSSALTRELATGIRLECGQRITRIEYLEDQAEYPWKTFIQNNGEECLFSQSTYLVLATPPEQAYALVPQDHPYKSAFDYVETLPQWVSVFYVADDTFNTLGLDQVHAVNTPESSVIKRVSLESVKADRTPPEHGQGVLVKVEAQPMWSKARTDYDKEDIAQALWRALWEIKPVLKNEVGLDILDQPLYCYTHRWLYSLPQQNVLSRAGQVKGLNHLGPQENLCLCGDYLGMGRGLHGVEAAYLSGTSLAMALIQTRQGLSQTSDVSKNQGANNQGMGNKGMGNQ